MMTLYEIDQALLDLVDPETGEVADFEAFQQLQMDREAKLEGVALWIKDLRAEAKALADEIKTLTERKVAAENRTERLKGYLMEALQGEKFRTARAAVSYRASSAVEIEDLETAVTWLQDHGYERYITWPTPTVSKTDVKKVLQYGVAVPGVKEVEKTNIIIK